MSDINDVLSGIFTGKLDPGLLRPFIGRDGKTYMTMKADGGLRTVPVNANGTLRRDEWKQIDKEILRVSRYRLTGMQDLIDNNLTVPLNSPLATIEYEHHKLSEAMEAAVTMDPAVRSRKDRPNYESAFVPIPLVHSDFSINLRALEASRRGGGSDLQMDSVTAATEVVNERLESMLFADETFKYGRGRVWSYVNFPDRHQMVLAEPWNTADPDDILEDVLGMMQVSIDARHYGPWNLYLPGNCYTVPDRDYTQLDGGMTIRQRLLNLEGLQNIRVSHFLANDNILLVEMQSRTVRLLRGLDPTALQWTINGGFTNEFKVFAIMVPEIRSDAAGRTGIVHLA